MHSLTESDLQNINAILQNIKKFPDHLKGSCLVVSHTETIDPPSLIWHKLCIKPQFFSYINMYMIYMTYWIYIREIGGLSTISFPSPNVEVI